MKRLHTGFVALILSLFLVGCEPSSLIAYTNNLSCSFDTIAWQVTEQDNDMMEVMVQIFNLDCD